MAGCLMASDRSFPRNYGCYRGEGLDHLLDDNVRRVQDQAAVLVVLHLFNVDALNRPSVSSTVTTNECLE